MKSIAKTQDATAGAAVASIPQDASETAGSIPAPAPAPSKAPQQAPSKAPPAPSKAPKGKAPKGKAPKGKAPKGKAPKGGGEVASYKGCDLEKGHQGSKNGIPNGFIQAFAMYHATRGGISKQDLVDRFGMKAGAAGSILGTDLKSAKGWVLVCAGGVYYGYPCDTQDATARAVCPPAAMRRTGERGQQSARPNPSKRMVEVIGKDAAFSVPATTPAAMGRDGKGHRLIAGGGHSPERILY